MAGHRSLRIRSTLGSALLGMTALSGCGIHMESIAQPPLLAVIPDASIEAPAAALSALAPCIPGAGMPHAASVVSDLLLGKDPYATDCARQARPIVEPAPLGLPTRTAPATQPDTGMVTDELVGAVLTGASGFWYQPVIGSA